MSIKDQGSSKDRFNPEASILLHWAAMEMLTRRQGTDSAAFSREARPIDECPQCRYSLQGLPDRYHCPECGFEYDKDTFCWTYPGSKCATIIWLAIVMGLLTFVIANGQTPNVVRWSYTFALLFLAVAVVVRRLLMQLANKSMIVTAPRGLLVRDLSGIETVIPYGEIEAMSIELSDASRCNIRCHKPEGPSYDVTYHIRPSAAQFREILGRRIRATKLSAD